VGYILQKYFLRRYMNTDQKDKINQMRQVGQSYFQIATSLSLSENTVKSFCRRNKNIVSEIQFKEETAQEDNTICKQCGKHLNQEPKRKPRKYCSDKCRFAWWYSHKELLTKNSIYKIKCAYCSNEFKSYGNKNRKFCGHACFIKSRFSKEGESDDARTV
jgi:endogenous inhibitor of DNA gyrase (YacG/DUF329 family)